jgi:nicotinamidase-related amidase
VDLFEHGIVPRVLANACGSHAGSDAHERGLQVLERFIGLNQVVR